MALKWGWLMALGLPLVLVGGMPARGSAATTEQNAAPAAKTEKAENSTTEASGASTAPIASEKSATAPGPVGLAGKIVAVTPDSHTIVVDVPLGKETLRIGAEATDATKILVGGKKASLNALKEGERVRISYHRTAMGDVANSVVALETSKG